MDYDISYYLYGFTRYVKYFMYDNLQIDKKAMAASGMVARVRQEVSIHSRLKHPSILELYTFFEDSNYVYLVLELAHNGELQRYIKNNMLSLTEREGSLL